MVSITNQTQQSDLKLLVFENDWCAQCYTERPVVVGIQQIYPNQLQVEFVDVDDHPELVEQYQIRSAPSLVLIKNQRVVENIPRFIDQPQLQAVINYYL